MSKILVFIGTRPEILKMAPLIGALDRKGADFKLVYTGQHYDRNMSGIFFEEFGLREPDLRMRVGGTSRPEQVASCIKEGAKLIGKEKPKMCVVNGDTNTTLGCAMAAATTGVPYAHVEAGCRSFDLMMPEEVNRLITDRCASLLFPPTNHCFENLLVEGIPRRRCAMLGNTAVDTFKRMRKRAEGREVKGVEEDGFALVTIHRQENADDKKSLGGILSALSKLGERVVFPIHPRTRKNVARFGLGGLLKSKNITLLEPLGYLDFLSLVMKCSYIISDSGGVIEEAAFARKRIVIPRINVEWYEIIEKGVGVLSRPDEKDLLKAVGKIKAMRGAVPEVYPDLNASERTAGEIMRRCDSGLERRDFIARGRPRLRLNAKGEKHIDFDEKGFVTFEGKAKNGISWVDY